MAEKESYAWRLGEILIQNGWINWQQLEKALEIQASTGDPIDSILVAKGFVPKRKIPTLHLGEILVQHGWITWKQLSKALEKQQNSNRILGEILVEEGFVSEEDLYQALAMQYHMSFVDFDKVTVPLETLKLLPKRNAYELGAMPLVKKENMILIAISDPLNLKPEGEIRKLIPQFEIHTALAIPKDLKQAIFRYYGPE